MTKFLLVVGAFVLLAAGAPAEEPAQKTGAEHESTKATFIITGLHCPPCTKTVETSLHNAKGIRSIKVDWKTKNASVEFDEKLIPAQSVARLIADTPHMMGRSMHYEGWLVLMIRDSKDGDTAKAAQDALSKVEGVKRVAVYPAQHAVGVEFAAKGEVTTEQLIHALKKAGLIART